MAENNVAGTSPVEPSGGQKKKLPALAWVAIGCGALILIGFIMMSAGAWFAAKKIKDVAGDFEDNPAKSAAELIVAVNPDLELVESDDSEGTITVRQKSTGEIASFDYSQIQEGKLGFEAGGEEFSVDVTGAEEGGLFTLKTDEGEARFGTGGAAGEVPDFVPIYPGGSEPQVTYTASSDAMTSGILSIESSDRVEKVLEYYRTTLEESGYQVNVSTYSGADGGQAGSATGTNPDTNSTVNASATRDGDVTRITIQYSGTP